ncbi:MAG: PP2C family protein-serine/threonine phosphatase [Planctomycetes bacterium]|nr:PP2C family protein-serine/threonine phosphatase [Planctomycetota bacterium]
MATSDPNPLPSSASPAPAIASASAVHEYSSWPKRDWRNELSLVVDLMKDVSRQTEPQELVRIYGEGIEKLMPERHLLALSRRGLEAPWYRITRSTTWSEDINPWTQKDRLPLLKGGFLETLAYSSEPVIIDDLQADVRLNDKDPAWEYLKDRRSLMTIPQYDNGEALNVAVLMYDQPYALDHSRIPNMVWQGNLFGRTTHTLVLRKELTEAYARIDHELEVVGEIQRSLLPKELPSCRGLDLAATYHPSARAGGDYYDLFPLDDGRLGLFIADVSGHGTPAAVMMAITHAIAHSMPESELPPGQMLTRLNSLLLKHYTNGGGSFVTAFYGVFDPRTRELVYACAGHNPPRIRRSDNVFPLAMSSGLPLGVMEMGPYTDCTVNLEKGDVVLLYTDGITEAFAVNGDMFGEKRLDEILAVSGNRAQVIVDAIEASVKRFAAGRAADDDQTVLAARVE